MRYEVHRNEDKWSLLSTHRTSKAAIKAAEVLALKESKPYKIRQNGLEEWAKFGVFDSVKRHYLGFAVPPKRGY